MELFIQFVVLFLGFIFLWKAGDFAVKSAMAFSLVFGIEKFTVGFFIFSFSTALPEISGTIVATWKKVPALSAGDIMGSVLVNTSLILGITVLLAKKIHITSDLRKRVYRTMALIALIFIGVAIVKTISIFTGVLLLIIYVGAAIWFQAGIPKKMASKEIHELEQQILKLEKKALLSPKIDVCVKLFLSLAFLLFSSWMMVRSGSNIARMLHFDLTLLGATLIAVGTSLPELTLEIHAVKKKEYSLALGNIFGSSLLDVTFILGLLTILNPQVDLSFSRQLLPFLLVCMAWVAWKLFRDKPIVKKDGVIFISLFLLYIAWVVFVPLFGATTEI
jgi:cation:H+ antiporter